MSKEPHVSPSQQTTFIHGCQRAWAFVYILGYPKGDNKFSDRGKRTHKVLEDWTQFGKPPDIGDLYGRIAKPALVHIPPPKHPGVLSEANVLWRSPNGHLFNFLKDLELPGAPVSYIWDYKTTSNLDYAHTTEELLNTDPQGVTYPAHRFIETPDCVEVRSSWLYLTANLPNRCVPVNAVHRKEHCLARFALFDKIAGVMLRHREAKTHPMAFAPGVHHCGAFGGCPFKSLCNLSPMERMMSAMDQADGPNTKNFFARIDELAAGGGSPPPGAQAPAVISAPIPPPQPVFQPPVQQQVQAPALPWMQQAAPVIQPPAPVIQPPAPVMPVPIVGQVQMPWLQAQQQAAAPVSAIQPPVLVPANPGAFGDTSDVTVVTETTKRKRRTKAEMEAARLGNVTLQDEQLPQTQREEEEAAAPTIELPDNDRVSSKPVVVQLPGQRDMLLREAVLAMLHNPGYSSLDSVALVERASAITGAFLSEVSE